MDCQGASWKLMYKALQLLENKAMHAYPERRFCSLVSQSLLDLTWMPQHDFASMLRDEKINILVFGTQNDINELQGMQISIRHVTLYPLFPLKSTGTGVTTRQETSGD
jgi:hypothetical protein